MSRKILLNILENVFPPSVNQAMKTDLLGNTPKVTALAAETTLTLDFSENASHDVTLGSANLTALNATVGDLQEGERVTLRITQDGTAARTVAWGTGFEFAGGTGPTVTASTDAVDIFDGVVSGGVIVLMIVAQDIS